MLMILLVIVLGLVALALGGLGFLIVKSRIGHAEAWRDYKEQSREMVEKAKRERGDMTSAGEG